MKCLLCESDVVADLLCVPCGAKKWAADFWLDKPLLAAEWSALAKGDYKPTWNDEQNEALCDINTTDMASAFLNHLEAARKAREAAPLCSRGCMSHEDPK